MDEHRNFIGIGHNPNPGVPDIPLGLGMALFQEAEARSYFESLSDEEKTSIIRYVQEGNVTGEDARHKVTSAIENLKNNSINFI